MEMLEKKVIDIVSENMINDSYKECRARNQTERHEERKRMISYCADIYKKEEAYIINTYSRVLPGLKLNKPTKDHHEMIVQISTQLAKLVETARDKVIVDPKYNKEDLGLMGKWINLINFDYLMEGNPKGPIAVPNNYGKKIIYEWAERQYK